MHVVSQALLMVDLARLFNWAHVPTGFMDRPSCMHSLRNTVHQSQSGTQHHNVHTPEQS